MLNVQWQSIASYQIGGAHAALFIDKLQRRTGWTGDFCLRAIGEYKRFIYIASANSTPVSGSSIVDEVWRLHFTFSQCYWENLCTRVLGQPLHHHPHIGHETTMALSERQYAATLSLYKVTFGEAPPEVFWPKIEPADRNVVAATHKAKVIPRNLTNRLVIAAVVGLPGSAWATNEHNLNNALQWLPLWLVALIVFWVLMAGLSSRKSPRRNDRGRFSVFYDSQPQKSDYGDKSNSDSTFDSGCGGGE